MADRNVRALSFDCYGTLIDWESGLLAELQPWAQRHGVEADPDELLAIVAKLETAVQSEHRTMRYPDVLAEVLRRLAATLDADASADECSSFGASVGRWPAFPDSVQALGRLKARYALVILSNIDRRSFAASNERLGVEFDVVITAEDVGSYKPDPANFVALVQGLEALGFSRGELVHVAQSLYHDHEPAGAAGIETVWIDRRHGRPGGATPPPAEGFARPERRYPTLAAFADAFCP